MFSLFIQKLRIQQPAVLIPQSQASLIQTAFPPSISYQPPASNSSLAQEEIKDETEEKWVSVPLGEWFFDEGMMFQLEQFALQVADFDATGLYKKIKNHFSE